MIVRNEAANLADCLGPLAHLFNEIIVVDTGSHDDTKKIAARFTPRVFDFAWCDDFSAARNAALAHATGEWIFWLDADDRVSADQLPKLPALLAELGELPRAYFMDTVCASRHACEDARLISHPRLFKRHRDLAWQGRVHEQLRPGFDELGYETLWSDIQIDHVGYVDATLRTRKLNRDVRLLRMDYAVDPENSSTLVHLGLAHFRLGNFAEARQHLHRLLQRAPSNADYLRQVHAVLAECSLREGRAAEALGILAIGLHSFPSDENLLLLAAECQYELDQFAAAQSTLAQIIGGPPSSSYRGGGPREIRRKLAPRKLGDVLRLRRDFAAAELILRSVVTEFPDDTLSWYALGRVYSDANCGDNVLAVAQRLHACPQGNVFAALLLAAWHLGRNELPDARQQIDWLIAEAPQMPMPRLLRAEWLFRANAPLAARMQACRDLLRVQPGNAEAQRVLRNLELAAQGVASPAAAVATVPGVLVAG